jgi:hypothetical protein
MKVHPMWVKNEIDNGVTAVTSGAPVELLYRRRVFICGSLVRTEVSVVTVRQLPSSFHFSSLSVVKKKRIISFLKQIHRRPHA